MQLDMTCETGTSNNNCAVKAWLSKVWGYEIWRASQTSISFFTALVSIVDAVAFYYLMTDACKREAAADRVPAANKGFSLVRRQLHTSKRSHQRLYVQLSQYYMAHSSINLHTYA